jgi:hypothetical protein
VRRRCVYNDVCGEGAIQAVASAKNRVQSWLFGLLFVSFSVLIVANCSAQDAGDSESGTPEAAATPDDATSTGDESSSATEGGPVATGVAEPSLADEDLASVTVLEAGAQVEDAQGNLISIYGLAEWPEPFEDLSDAAQADFPFFGDVAAVGDPATELVVLDIGMCATGIDATGFGTAEFFVHDSPDDVVSTDQVLDRGVLAHHPVVQPGFKFPATATCSRGLLPVLWTGDDAPTIARYVLTTPASGAAEVERHVYQWDLDGQIIDPADMDVDESSLFDVGQTVTFNEGRLAELTVEVGGWAEMLGATSEIDSTRVVAVSMSFCPSSPVLPEFGLAVDGWSLVAPADDDELFGARTSDDAAQSCFEGWLEFVVPFGGTPTGFFASDGADSINGYAEWSLANAALPTPQ